ncbi:MAG: hypothetical protein LUC37_07340, partial [Prevotella sp.]|nr:hypothetical protein [Prevotella sp.]
YKVDPSQGTHFFHNLTSFGVGYLTLDVTSKESIYKKECLDSLSAIDETDFIRHVRFKKPLTVLMDGMSQKAVITFNKPVPPEL